ncbi:MAG: STAS domain-containing protein [Lachnospiraceae bacterium]|nr:STAS domain-containing protein [Lachnospiraceae bacterium]
MLNVEKNMNGATMEMALIGRLDSVTAPELKEILSECMLDADKLILDFAQLEYLSSAGLRVLLEAYKKMSDRDGMVIRNVNDVIMQVFKSVGFAKILTIE